MEPSELGEKYDRISQWWHDQHVESLYGVSQFERAVAFASGGGRALDVGCGSGGRFVRILGDNGFSVTGVDVSKEMVGLANNNHPEHTDQWRDDTFYYSSIGINENVQLLINEGLSILHLELDDYPGKHVYTIATRPIG